MKAIAKKQTRATVSKRKSSVIIPKTYLSINKKLYRAINPEKAVAVAKKLSSGIGTYKVHVIYGKEQISKRKFITVENEGKYKSAKETRQAILAFLDKSLWMKE